VCEHTDHALRPRRQQVWGRLFDKGKATWECCVEATADYFDGMGVPAMQWRALPLPEPESLYGVSY
jgi:hypothetical protein